MKIGEMAQLMQPWSKLKISDIDQVNIHGERIWTRTLTEAQVYAYWDWEIVKSHVEEKTATVYCIIKK